MLFNGLQNIIGMDMAVCSPGCTILLKSYVLRFGESDELFPFNLTPQDFINSNLIVLCLEIIIGTKCGLRKVYPTNSLYAKVFNIFTLHSKIKNPVAKWPSISFKLHCIAKSRAIPLQPLVYVGADAIEDRCMNDLEQREES